MNISDLSASVNYKETKEAITFHTQTDLVNEDQNSPAQGRINCKINYQIEDECIHITIEGESKMPEGCRYIIPIVSRNNEKAEKKDNEVVIHNNVGSIKVLGNTIANILPSRNGRIFNYVPGLEAVPIAFGFDNNGIIKIQMLFEKST